MIKVIHIEADLEYDADMFHDDSEDEWDWFSGKWKLRAEPIRGIRSL